MFLLFSSKLLKLRKIFIFLIGLGLIYILYSIFLQLNPPPPPIILPNEIPPPILNISSETEIAIEDANVKMETIIIKFKNYKLKYHIKIKEKEEINCKNKILLILIPSKPENFQQRINVRNSWLVNKPPTVIYRFITGFTPNATIRVKNRNESQTFNDLIIIDLLDSYLNLTLKTYALLDWQQINCPEIKYILKADDDSAVNIQRLLYWIEKEFDDLTKKYYNKVIFGFVMRYNPPYRDSKSKWYVPKYAWKEKYFPNYCNGPSYLLTSTAAELILQEAQNFYPIFVEDAFFTGILAEAAGIQRIDKPNIFSIKFVNDSGYYGCDGNGIPYLTSIYHIGEDKFYLPQDKENPMKAANEILLKTQCPNNFISFIYSFWYWLRV